MQISRVNKIGRKLVARHFASLQSNQMSGASEPLMGTDSHTGILLTLKDQPGMLNSVLNVFQDKQLNLTSIQSKPPKLLKGTKEVSFYIDFQGSPE